MAEFLKQPADRLTPGWVVKDFQAKCPTCKDWITGGADGLIKHLQQVHHVKPPDVRHVRVG